MNQSKIYLGVLSIFFIIIAIYQAVILNDAHFYSLFSVGMTLILGLIYYTYFKKPLFKNWKSREFSYFFILLIISCIIIDQIGIYLGYWTYPQYSGIYDEVIKILLEFALPFLYITLALIIGKELFEKLKINPKVSFILSLLIFVTLIGLITETLNNFVYSWKILDMPLTNQRIGSYYLVFLTIGYWLMAVITYSLYKFINLIKK